MLTKQNVIESINNLPDTFTADDIIDRIILLAKVDIGIEQSDKNDIIPDEELDKILR